MAAAARAPSLRHMPSVKQLRPFAHASLKDFLAASGPVALIQQPPELVFQKVSRGMRQGGTVIMAHRSRLVERLLVMLRAFDALEVLFLQPTSDGQTFTVGRLDTSDISVHDPSVSKVHAWLRWDAATGACWLRDAGSTNGTFVNAMPLGDQEQQLEDGDALAFGDAQFLYARTETLHAQLRAVSPTEP